jgi:hypothetical protein
MNFPYRKFPVDPANCPFPEKKSSLRPVIRIDFDTSKGIMGYLVLIDSGADYCIFHAGIGEALGLKITEGKVMTFYGVSGQKQKAYFHKVIFKIGGHEHACQVGFSYDLDKMAYGILGQDGFFDKWSVKFEYKKEKIELKQT